MDNINVYENEYFHVMLDLAPLCCFFLNRKLEILECNRYALRVFGASNKDELLGRQVTSISPQYQPDGKLSVEVALKESDKAITDGVSKYEWMGRSLQETPLPFEVTLVRILFHGEVCLLAYMRDLRALNYAISMVKHLEEIAYSDPLTGVYNRRFFLDEALRELQSSINYNYGFHVMMVDIDFFKKVNDTHGHMIGDEVLKILAVKMQQAVRHDTLIARYGGEEFIIMVTQADKKAAEVVAWRVRDAVAISPFTVDDLEIPITVSIGLASNTSPTETLADLIGFADKALYEAKNSGRNTVVVYQ